MRGKPNLNTSPSIRIFYSMHNIFSQVLEERIRRANNFSHTELLKSLHVAICEGNGCGPAREEAFKAKVIQGVDHTCGGGGSASVRSRRIMRAGLAGWEATIRTAAPR